MSREILRPSSPGAILYCLVVLGCSGSNNTPAASPPTAALRPLTVQAANPLYFSDSARHTVYVTGSHTWTNFQDGDDTVFDYGRYLGLLTDQHHNFIRLWVSESPQADVWLFPAPGWNASTGPWYERVSPMPYLRNGPGLAADGLPKFDLSQFNEAYFDRLRARVIAARDRGIYVSLMLFNFWTAANMDAIFPGRNVWRYHPYNATNNVNGLSGDLDGDGDGSETHTLAVAEVTRVQEAYVRRVIEAVNDLDNVLYEISNEDIHGDPAWQFHMIQFIKAYEADKPRQHPVGMTGAQGIDNALLLTHPGEWLSFASKHYDSDADPLNSNPPEATGAKVSILDTDHTGYALFRQDPAFTAGWVWKGFLRGHSPILMEDLTESPGWVAGRAAMGHTRHYAERIGLDFMAPHSRLSSTGYCLAHPGHEYLVYQPESATFSVSLAAGPYAVEWFDPSIGRVVSTGAIDVAGGPQSFTPPQHGPLVLYLVRTQNTGP